MGVEDIDEGHVGGHRAPEFRRLVHDGAHEFAAGASAPDHDAARLGDACVDEVAGDIDEVGEGVGSLLQLNPSRTSRGRVPCRPGCVRLRR